MDAYAALDHSVLFAGLERRAIKMLAESAQWVTLRGGANLYSVGDPGDALFVLVNGRLRITRPRLAQRDAVLGEVALGESVGEIAVINGEARTTVATAMRDSAVLRISTEDFEQMTRRYPDAMLRVTRLIVQRLQKDYAPDMRDPVHNARTYAVLPAHPGIDVRGFAQAFANELADGGACLRLDPERVAQALGDQVAATPFEETQDNRRLSLWLNRIEERYRYLVYQATNEPDSWTRRCLRQADRIIVVAHSGRETQESGNLNLLKQGHLGAPVELALLQAHTVDIQPVSAFVWREYCGAEFHHNIGVDHASADMAKMARLTSGRGVCLVLGGGGARGFAHLGLIRALHEKGVAVDAVGGTSMGALVAAMVAMGMDYEAMLKTLRTTFVEHNYLNDYSLSRLSLISGKKIRAQLDSIFGDLRIEDLKLPFYCVSTSLTHGRPVIHDRGRVADWVATSMAVPGIAPPTVYQGELLVDGGLMHGVDFDTMATLGRGRVIFSDVSRASDVSLDGMAQDAPDSLINLDYKNKNLSIFKILFRSATLIDERKKLELFERADLVFHMPVGELGMFDWEELDDIAYRAYHYSDEVLDAYLQKHPELRSNDVGEVPTRLANAS